MVENVFVLLLGFPGVGKLTIARELGTALSGQVIDNHWINNPILALLADDGRRTLPDAVWEQTAKVRQAVLDTWQHFVLPSPTSSSRTPASKETREAWRPTSR